jgi:subtilase family serine protease
MSIVSVRKGVLKGFVFVAGALALGIVATPKKAEADLVRAPLITLGTSIALSCSNPGSHQDVAKTPILKNITTAPIKAGQTVHWKASDGDYGSMKLQADLAPGASISTIGKPGQSYTCTSNFFTSADLTVQSAQFTYGFAGANVTVQNLDSWVDAPPSIVRVEVVSCNGGAVLASADSSAVALAKGQSKTLSVPFASAPSGRKYLRVRADANKQVIERNEANNLLDDYNSCLY